MPYHSTADLLGLKGLNVKRIYNTYSFVKIYAETKPSPQICPRCGDVTSRIHDYRSQTFRDLPIQQKSCLIVLRKRRYLCKGCGKRFDEKQTVVPKYLRRTARMTAFIASAFRGSTTNIKTVAESAGVSPATVRRILSSVCFPSPPPSMPSVLSIDEFRGNAGAQKYQVILTAPKRHQVIDILPERTEAKLGSYFHCIPPKEREKVRFFSCDMYAPYARLAHQYFPQAQVVVDRYHFVRQVSWAMESVRKRIQKTMPPQLRRYYKRSHRLMLSRFEKLSPDDQEACNVMLLYNDDLRRAHWLQEEFYRILDERRYSLQRKMYRDWIDTALQSGLHEFKRCAMTFYNWRREILASLKHRDISNAVTEGFNNKIKVLKRTSYGVRDFHLFRTRILMAMNW